MDWELLIKEILYTVIVGVTPILTYYLVNFLKALFDKAKVSTENLVIQETVNEALDLILRIVTSTSQTYVESLKASGEFDEEAQRIAFEKSKTAVLDLLSESSKQILTTLYGDLNLWVDIQIESAVNMTKKNNLIDE